MAETWQPRIEARPTERLPVMLKNDVRGKRMGPMIWGLIPSWNKPTSPMKPLINARVETIFEKPSFRTIVQRQRCVVPASAWYEWHTEPSGQKQAFRFQHQTDPFLAMAAVFERLQRPDQPPEFRFAIVTDAAAAHLAHIHDRMPLLLDAAQRELWANVQTTYAELVEIISKRSIQQQIEYTAFSFPSNPSKRRSTTSDSEGSTLF